MKRHPLGLATPAGSTRSSPALRRCQLLSRHLPMRLRYLILAMSGVVVASSACSVDSTAPQSLAAPAGAGLSKGQSPDLPNGNAKPVKGTTEDDSSTYVITI